MAYNDEFQNRLRLQHFFFPGLLYFGIEVFLSIIILVLMNLGSIAEGVLTNTIDQTNPIDFAKNGLSDIWHWLNQLEIFMHGSIFVLWSLAGVLGYLLIFSIFKFIYTLIYSAEEAADLIKNHSGSGILFWFSTINEAFKSMLVKIVGTVLLFVSAFILFGYAGSFLQIGLLENFPDSLINILIALAVAILGMRVFVSGIGLLFPAFRGWYYA